MKRHQELAYKLWARRVVIIACILILLFTMLSVFGCATKADIKPDTTIGFQPLKDAKVAETIDIGDEAGRDLQKLQAELEQRINEVEQKALVAYNKSEEGSGKYLFYAVAVIALLSLVGFIVAYRSKYALKEGAKQGLFDRRKR